MKNINPNTTLAELTVAEFMELQNSMNNKDKKLYIKIIIYIITIPFNNNI